MPRNLNKIKCLWIRLLYCCPNTMWYSEKSLTGQHCLFTSEPSPRQLLDFMWKVNLNLPICAQNTPVSPPSHFNRATTAPSPCPPSDLKEADLYPDNHEKFISKKKKDCLLSSSFAPSPLLWTLHCQAIHREEKDSERAKAGGHIGWEKGMKAEVKTTATEACASSIYSL